MNGYGIHGFGFKELNVSQVSLSLLNINIWK
jgi:hypothetical protein